MAAPEERWYRPVSKRVSQNRGVTVTVHLTCRWRSAIECTVTEFGHRIREFGLYAVDHLGRTDSRYRHKSATSVFSPGSSTWKLYTKLKRSNTTMTFEKFDEVCRLGEAEPTGDFFDCEAGMRKQTFRFQNEPLLNKCFG